ncbi:holo-ACP synthase [Mucilaginibacter rubeus]|uniref:Holo-[acyl-carrier-protein] synthase n=1 Tax=Mucilaginibacter rubeus TaxID=2027860 RepID=A0A5C1I561_9SPHI|nr:holo-ACP synthase [Mucilaginibacter rubeus]QEM13065.1 holo-[acyl-carrier-protein] synthase [Mucilaginibacter rubeus]
MTVAGVGIDMIEVERVQSSIAKEQGFRELVFSAREIAYCEGKANKYQHYAARFAAKEAFFKALGTGWLKDTAFNEIEISNDENGKPYLEPIGESAIVINRDGPLKISVSLTHLKTMASAVVIIEK